MTYKRTLLTIGIIVLAALLFWYSTALHELFYDIVSFFDVFVKQNETLGLFVFVLIAVLSALISPLTNIPLIPVAVALWGIVPTMALLLGGWLLGDVIAYYVGRFVGYPAVRYIISPERFDGWVANIRDHTGFFMGFLLRLTLPAELGYAFGLIRYRFWKYFLLTLLAELPYAFVTVYASEAILSGEQIRFFGLIALATAVFLGALYVIRKH